MLKVGNISVNKKAWSEQIARYLKSQGFAIEDLQRSEHKVEILSDMSSKFVNDLLLKNEVMKLGLDATDDMAKLDISAKPNFFGTDGKFSSEKLSEFMAANGLTEADFLGIVKDNIGQASLISPLVSNNLYPETPLKVLFKAINIKKKATLYKLVKANIDPVKPSEPDIEAFYANHKSDYFYPEVRDIKYIIIGVNDIKSESEPTEEELMKVYKERESMFSMPERRKIYDIYVNDPNEVNVIVEKLHSGETIDAIVKSKYNKIPISAKDNKGAFEPKIISRDMVEQQISTAIFDAQKGAFTKPIKVDESLYIVFFVDDILPQSVLKFEDVKAEFKKHYMQEKKYNALAKVAEVINDVADKNPQSSIDDIAKQFGVQIKTAKIRENVEPNGNIANSLELKTVVFSSTPGHVSKSAAYGEQLFAVQVMSVEKRKDMDLAQCRGEVIKAIQAEHVKTAAASKVLDMLNTIKSGTYKANDEVIVTNQAFSRESVKDFDPNWIQDLMRLANGEVSKPLEWGDAYYIAKINETVHIPDDAVNKAISGAQIDQMQPQIILLQYLEYLRTKYKVYVNDKAMLQYVIGAK